MPQLTVCPSCGEGRNPEDKFCGNCGASLTGAAGPRPAAPPPPPPPPPARRPWQPPATAPQPRGAADDEPAARSRADRSPGDPGAETVHIPVRPAQTPAALGADGRPPYAPPSAPQAAAAHPMPAQTVPDPAAHRAAAEGRAEHLRDGPLREGLRPDGPRRPDGAGGDGAGRHDYGEESADAYLLQPPAPGRTGQAPPAPRRPDPAPALSARTAAADPRKDLQAPAAEPPLCVACGTGLVDRHGHCERCGHAQPGERDHLECEAAGMAAVTDRGLRHHRNEDAFAVSQARRPDGTSAAIAVVCDGVSSAARPDEASAAAAEAASARLRQALGAGTRPREAMYDALLAAAEAVSALADPAEANAPACTCVSAVVAGEVVTVGWVGDSRAYWIPDDRAAEQPARLTEDDSWAARMVEAGLMSEEQAYADDRAHAITGWLGADAVDLDPHTVSFAPDRPGVVVICTDGLWNYAESAAEFAAAVRADARSRPLACAQALVGVALDGGGHDNITVAVLPFGGGSGND